VDLLNQRQFAGMRVLEIGGGQSTWWWAARAEHVITVESDVDWYGELVAAAPDNVELVNVPVDTQTRDVTGISRFLEGRPPFDVVVIDGHLREECARLTWPLLAEHGALIFDNSDGFNFQAVSAEWGAQRVDFYGYAAGSSRKTCSSVTFRDSCFLFDALAPIPLLD
jgi:protein-L-isoaspartate O-methyltransferase